MELNPIFANRMEMTYDIGNNKPNCGQKNCDDSIIPRTQLAQDSENASVASQKQSMSGIELSTPFERESTQNGENSNDFQKSKSTGILQESNPIDGVPKAVESMPSFTQSGTSEHFINERSEDQAAKPTPNSNSVFSTSNSVTLRTQFDSEDGIESSTPPERESTPSSENSNDFQKSESFEILEESNPNDGAPEAAELLENNQELIHAEHSYAASDPSVLRPESDYVIETKCGCKGDFQIQMPLATASTIEADICVVPSPPVSVQLREAFIFKTPQNIHHEFLYRFNIECTFRRLIIGARSTRAAAFNCQEQMSLQKTLEFNDKSVHHVTLHGECPKKVFQLNCHNWKDMQIVLEIVKNYSYKISVSEPPATIDHWTCVVSFLRQDIKIHKC